MTNIYDNQSDEALINEILALQEQEKEAKQKLKIAINALNDRKASEIESALREKDEPFGAVSQKIAGMKITFTTPKKVEWNQEGLAKLREEMLADGTNPDEYIKVEYSVSETAYKNWPSDIRAYFEPHRTVSPGNVATKIEPAKEK